MSHGGPAFPVPEQPAYRAFTGMTLLDYFAGEALKGWLSSFNPDSVHPVRNDIHESVALDSYKMAQAMLKVRSEFFSKSHTSAE